MTPTDEQLREHLLLESILAGTNIGIGLTAIRRYDFSDKGQFYAGMFSFTIGLERLLKLIVVLDYAQTHKDFPSNQYLKDRFRHRIGLLFNEARAINERRQLRVDGGIFADLLIEKIVDFLTSFASHARYYNLDLITGAAQSTDREPLHQWATDVCPELIGRHHRSTRRRRDDVAYGQALRNVRGVVVAHVGDAGTTIADVESLARETALIETKQKYSTFYLHRITMFGIGLFEALDRLDSNMQGISEVFRTIWCEDRRTIVNRRIWMPYR